MNATCHQRLLKSANTSPARASIAARSAAVSRDRLRTIREARGLAASDTSCRSKNFYYSTVSGHADVPERAFGAYRQPSQ